MNPLQRNEKTGFLEGNNSVSFTSDQKVKLLELTHQYIENFRRFPSIPDICKEIGVPVRTFDYHKKYDLVFKEKWDEIISVLKYVYDSNIAEKADRPNGIIAALSIRKYLETGSFLQQVTVNSNDQFASNKKIIEAVNIEIEPEIPDNQRPSA